MVSASLSGGVGSSGNGQGVLFTLDCDLFTFSTDAIGKGYNRGKSANFTQTPIIGAQSPIIMFANSTPMEINISFLMAAMSKEQLTDLNDLRDAFQALICPMQNGTDPPAICRLTLGSSGILQSFETLLARASDTAAPNQIWSQSGDPMDATFDLSFIEIARQTVSAKDWNPSNGKNYKYVGLELGQ